MRNLPAELLSMVLHSLSLSDLIAASHVDTFWRAIAFNHPTFWRFISLKSLSPAGVDCFVSRLDSSSLLDVELRVLLPQVQSRSQLRSAILSAISRNLHRISELHLEVDVKCDVDVFDALRKPAPRLETLNLRMVHDSMSSDLLPVDLFAQSAPQLQHVTLKNIQLTEDNIPCTFRCIVELSCLFEGGQTFQMAVFSHCPLLESLHISGTALLIDPIEEERPFPRKTVEKLRSLDLALAAGWTQLIRCIPCAHIASVTVPIDDEPAAAQLIGHLRGPLDLMVVRSGEGLSLQYYAPSSNMTRTFLCRLLGFELIALPPTYAGDDLLSRVETALSNKSLNSFRAFGRLPACAAVSLLIMDGDSLTPPTAALSVPQLSQIDIRSESGLSLASDELHKFLDAAFAAGANPVRVSLRGITLDGDAGVIDETKFILSVDT